MTLRGAVVVALASWIPLEAPAQTVTGASPGPTAPAPSARLPESSPVDPILAHASELRLSAAQMEKLDALRNRVRAEAVRRAAELVVAEMEAQFSAQVDPSDLDSLKQKVGRTEALRSETWLAAVRAGQEARGILTSDQRKRLALLVPPARTAVAWAGNPDLRQEIRALLRDEFKDQKMFEVETTQAIATRLWDWTKLLGLFVAAPLTVLGIVLGVLGVRTYGDFSKLLEKSRSDLEGRLRKAQEEVESLRKAAQQSLQEGRAQAQADADRLRQEGERLKASYAALERQLTEATALSEQVRSLQTKVAKIEERIEFRKSSALTPELKGKLQSSLDAFQAYLQKLGYRPDEGHVTVHVDPKLKDNAYYDVEKKLVVLGRPFAADPYTVLREYGHHALLTIAGKAVFGKLDGIESGLADYFAASFTGDPALGKLIAQEPEIAAFLQGKPYLRNLANDRQFHQAAMFPGSSNHVPQDIGEIWGGAFWQIRQAVGAALADQLLLHAWASIKGARIGGDRAKFFVTRILDADRVLSAGSNAEKIRKIFRDRGVDV